MTEEQFSSKRDPLGESGRIIPPVEGAWSLMRRKLDTRLPVTLPRMYSHAAWWSGAGAAVIVTAVTVVFVVNRPANRPLHPNPASNGIYQGTAKAGRMDSTTYTQVPEKANANQAPAAAEGRANALEAEDSGSYESIKADAAPAGLAGSASEALRTDAEKANQPFQPGKGPVGRSAGGEWALRRRWRKRQEESKAGSAAGRQSAGEPVSGQSAKEASVVHRVSLAQTEAVTHNQFCQVADSLLRASARRGQWVTTPASVAEKTKTLPVGYKGTKAKKDTPWERGPLRMAAGISGGKTFPIGGQEAYAYGANGKKAGLTDYIPHLYFRYYPRKHNYIQADLAIHSPQYTHSQVVDSFSAGTSTLPGWRSDPQYNTVTLKKLYYNDLGISFHYRLFDGLWLGAGIQVSQLSNAVGRKDTVLLAPVGGGRDTVFGSQIYGMKSGGGDYNELPKKDWRVTLQAAYSWRRWMLSVVFKDAIRTYTDEFFYGYKDHYRNSSWGVYLSYDLWERKRKK